MWGGDTQDYVNIQFLLRFSFTNYTIFQCILTVAILTVEFSAWWFCGSLLLSVFINWSYFVRKSCLSSSFVYLHLDLMDIHFTLWVIIIQYNHYLFCCSHCPALTPGSSRRAAPSLSDCSGDNGLEGSGVDAGTPGRKLVQHMERVMVVAWARMEAGKMQTGRRTWRLLRWQNGPVTETDWMWTEKWWGACASRILTSSLLKDAELQPWKSWAPTLSKWQSTEFCLSVLGFCAYPQVVLMKDY